MAFDVLVCLFYRFFCPNSSTHLSAFFSNIISFLLIKKSYLFSYPIGASHSNAFSRCRRIKQGQFPSISRCFHSFPNSKENRRSGQERRLTNGLKHNLNKTTIASTFELVFFLTLNLFCIPSYLQ